ncbi:MAG TPA: hypothetical protein VL171_07505 [Verrucomicrobiae bacterium]|nr:hypothetical protein [Verrucomicrobiae bacterium]
MRIIAYIRLLSFGLVLVSLSAGCGTVPIQNIQDFTTGVTAAQKQTTLAFQAVTDLTSDDVIDYAAAQPTLTDENFFLVLDPKAEAAWDRSFLALEKYGQDLVVLTSPDLTKDYKDYSVSLAEEIKKTGQVLQGANLVTSAPEPSAVLATAFTKLGDLLLRAKAQADAKRIVSATDPAVQQILFEMAADIGDSDGTGIRGTVHAHWQQRKGKCQVAFTKSDDAGKRKLAVQFAGLISQQQAQDAVLESLHRSLLALASAHRALAKGEPFSMAASIAFIKNEVQDTEQLYSKFKNSSED